MLNEFVWIVRSKWDMIKSLSHQQRASDENNPFDSRRMGKKLISDALNTGRNMIKHIPSIAGYRGH